MTPSAPLLFRPSLITYGKGLDLDGYAEIPLEPADAAGLAVLLQSGRYRPSPGHGLHVSLVNSPGLADIPLVISGGPDGPWVVSTIGIAGESDGVVLAEIPAADPALSAEKEAA